MLSVFFDIMEWLGGHHSLSNQLKWIDYTFSPLDVAASAGGPTFLPGNPAVFGINTSIDPGVAHNQRVGNKIFMDSVEFDFTMMPGAWGLGDTQEEPGSTRFMLIYDAQYNNQAAPVAADVYASVFDTIGAGGDCCHLPYRMDNTDRIKVIYDETVTTGYYYSSAPYFSADWPKHVAFKKYLGLDTIYAPPYGIGSTTITTGCLLFMAFSNVYSNGSNNLAAILTGCCRLYYADRQ